MHLTPYLSQIGVFPLQWTPLVCLHIEGPVAAGEHRPEVLQLKNTHC